MKIIQKIVIILNELKNGLVQPTVRNHPEYPLEPHSTHLSLALPGLIAGLVSTIWEFYEVYSVSWS